MASQDIKDCVPEDKYKKFCDFTFNKALDEDGSIAWCPTPGCTYAFGFEHETEFSCPVCKKDYCIKCRKMVHKNMTCEQYAA